MQPQDIHVSFAWASGLIFFIVVISKNRPLLQKYGNHLISWIIHQFLIWWFPIKSVDGKHNLPTCLYQWPNGQGDVSKFLKGEENSTLWRQKHGRIYRVWGGMKSEVVLTRAEDIQLVFADSDKHIKAANNDSGWLMGELLGNCVGLVSGRKWEKLRAITEVPFLHNAASSYVDGIEWRVKRHFDSLHENGALNQGILNPVDDFKFLPFSILADIIYGEAWRFAEEELRNLIPLRESIFAAVIQGGITRFSWSQYISLSRIRDLRTFKKAWSNFNDKVHEKAVEHGISSPIVQYYEAIGSGVSTKEEILQTLDEMLFANLDVTMGGISWVLMFLASNQKMQTELYEEIKQSTFDRDERDELKSYISSSSTLLSVFIMESSRLKPLAAFSVPQGVPTSRIVGGFIIPAGTNCIVDSHALNTNTTFWGDDSNAFRPSRFLERSATKSRYQFWRFGFGPRTCMGKHIANIIMRVLLTHLVKNYNLQLISGETAWEKNKETWISHPDTVLRCEKR